LSSQRTAEFVADIQILIVIFLQKNRLTTKYLISPYHRSEIE